MSHIPTVRASRQAATPNLRQQREQRTVAPTVGRTAGTVGQRSAGVSQTTTSRALVQSPNGRLGVRDPTFASLSVRDPTTRTLAQSTFSGNFTQTTWTNDWRWRRNSNLVIVLGFFGPVFWPYFYSDFIDYTFWPYAYDTFWPYAYDDFYAGIYGGYAPDDYEYYGSSYAYAPGRDHAASREGVPAAATVGSVCSGQTQGLTDFPIERIAQQVSPDEHQRALLDDLKEATAEALRILRAACPADLASTPTGRLVAMRGRVDAMLRAVQVVRSALDKFYDALSDEQKERFNAFDSEALRKTAGRRPALARACNTRATNVPVARIERSLRLSARQEATLRELKGASAQAADLLAQNCPTEQTFTPTGRLAAMEQRLGAMLQALDTVRPVLARFYDSLTDKQRARFDRLGGRPA